MKPSKKADQIRKNLSRTQIEELARLYGLALEYSAQYEGKPKEHYQAFSDSGIGKTNQILAEIDSPYKNCLSAKIAYEMIEEGLWGGVENEKQTNVLNEEFFQHDGTIVTPWTKRHGRDIYSRLPA